VRDEYIDLYQGLKELPKRRRQALELWLSGWKQREIAELMDVHRSTISRWNQHSVHILSKFFTVEYE